MSRYVNRDGVWCDKDLNELLFNDVRVYTAHLDANLRDRMNFISGLARQSGFIGMSASMARDVARHICELEDRCDRMARQLGIYADAERTRKERERKQKERERSRQEVTK